jgi:hypothetical protein
LIAPSELGGRDDSQRGPSLLEADVKEIVAPTSIDASESLLITFLCRFFLNFLETVYEQITFWLSAKFLARGVHIREASQSICQILSAAMTRGMPARSLVTPMLVQAEASRRGWTAGRELWPSSRTRIPPDLRCWAD